MTCPSDILLEWTSCPQRTAVESFWSGLTRCGRDRATSFELGRHESGRAWMAAACRAGAAILCHRGGRTVGMFVAIFAPGSRTAEVHAAFTDDVSGAEALGVCARARAMVAERTDLRNLFAFVPTRWRHIRALAARMGFTEIARLPELVRVARLGRHVEGVILHLDLAPYRPDTQEAAHA